MKLTLTPSADRITNIVQITGDSEHEIRQHLTVDVIETLKTVPVTDWIRACRYAAYDRKCSIASMMFWPLRDVVFDIVYNASSL